MKDKLVLNMVGMSAAYSFLLTNVPADFRNPQARRGGSLIALGKLVNGGNVQILTNHDCTCLLPFFSLMAF